MVFQDASLGRLSLLASQRGSEPPGRPSRPPSSPPPQVKSHRAVLDSPSMAPTMHFIEKLSRTQVTVTIFGETGTGKDVVARTLHERSARADKPFVVFDCGAVAPNLIESELLGHERGSFTGALTTYLGAFERAQGGTLFLDEIGELPLELQPRLLRALENRQIRRVGGAENRAIDVRVIAATNRNLQDEVRLRRFREDLYFRLAGAPIHLPSLRSRKEDIPDLCKSLLGDLNAPSLTLTPRALEKLAEHDWPGNVRELKNVLSCALCLVTEDVIDADHLQVQVRSPLLDPSRSFELAGMPLAELEKLAIVQTLALNNGHKTKTAESLGIALSTLYDKLKRYGLT